MRSSVGTLVEPPAIFSCRQCDKQFTWRKSLKFHLRFHSTQSFKFFCDGCGMKFMNKSSFEVHKETHNPHRVCQECRKVFTNKASFNHHLKKHKGEYTYKCYCGKGFMTASHFDAHSRTHTGQKPFACTECDSRFSRKDKLLEHLRRHSGVRPKKCDYCDYRGYTVADVKKHRHSGKCCSADIEALEKYEILDSEIDIVDNEI